MLLSITLERKITDYINRRRAMVALQKERRAELIREAHLRADAEFVNETATLDAEAYRLNQEGAPINRLKLTAAGWADAAAAVERGAQIAGGEERSAAPEARTALTRFAMTTDPGVWMWTDPESGGVVRFTLTEDGHADLPDDTDYTAPGVLAFTSPETVSAAARYAHEHPHNPDTETAR